MFWWESVKPSDGPLCAMAESEMRWQNVCFDVQRWRCDCPEGGKDVYSCLSTMCRRSRSLFCPEIEVQCVAAVKLYLGAST